MIIKLGYPFTEWKRPMPCFKDGVRVCEDLYKNVIFRLLTRELVIFQLSFNNTLM